DGLKPKTRKDCGIAQSLNEEQRQLVLDIRSEHPKASAELIVKTLVEEGRLPERIVSARVLRRLFQEQGLDRIARLTVGDRHARLRWEAAYPGALWQTDVCHGPNLRVDGRIIPIRVHA